MVQHKSNTVKSTGDLVSVLGASGGFNYRVISIVIPQQCDEIRFRVFSNAQKNDFCYSFSDRFNLPEIVPATLPKNDIYFLPMIDSNGFFRQLSQGIGFSEEIIIRQPSDFGETIYFSPVNVGDTDGEWGVQWQIIGGCKANGY